MIFQDPWKLHVEFGVYRDYKEVTLAAGESALGRLGIPAGELPKLAMPHSDDEPITAQVVQLDDG